jgi:hypothetical protein
MAEVKDKITGVSSNDKDLVTKDEYESIYGEKLERTLDIDTWHPGEDLAEMYSRLEKEIAEAKRQEDELRGPVRDFIVKKLRTRPSASKDCGLWSVPAHRIEEVHNKILFNGGVEACDGTRMTHDTVTVTVSQIGVCLVSYKGDQGSYVQRIFRRDLRVKGKASPEEIFEMLDRRKGREAVGQEDDRSELALRGIMAYAERAVLMDKSEAVWRMGHGNPAAWELLTGSGMDKGTLVRMSIPLLRRIIEGHQKFIFVPSSPKRDILTIGNALLPMEYIVLENLKGRLEHLVERGGYRGEGWGPVRDDLRAFAMDCGPKLVTGIYRVSMMAPPQVFFAHEDHVHTAALIAIADSVLQEHRGFPMLIDLADNMCRASFGSEYFEASIGLAYAEAGDPFSYMPERKTRR